MKKMHVIFRNWERLFISQYQKESIDVYGKKIIKKVKSIEDQLNNNEWEYNRINNLYASW